MSDQLLCQPSAMSEAEFVAYFKDLYEHSPWVAEGVYNTGLNSSHDQASVLHALFAKVMLGADYERQLALINAHPDLAGKAAIAGELTAASTSEQAGAGIHECSAEEFAEFTQLNDAYKAKFGFPFIKAVKGSDRHQILAAFRQRIHHSTEQEFAQALTEINKIAGFRLADM